MEIVQAISKLSMQGKKEYREPARSTKSTCNRKPARYRCIACGRPRSSTYHLRHPPEEPPPPQGICHRCVDKENQKEHLTPPPPPPLAITIYEIHYYHQACTCKREQHCASTHVELPLSPAHPRCAELSAEDRKGGSLPLSAARPGYAELPAEDRKGGSLPLYQLFERVPPPVKFGTKPNFRSG
jgi:hypothetical protein